MRFIILTLLMIPSFAQADVTARFIEGAPKDRFIIENTGPCGLDAGSLTIDLGPSTAGLIFDTTGSGAGVEVFQPLQITQGQTLLSATPFAKDGDTSLTLSFTSLPVNQIIAFTVDVDDTLRQSDSGQIIVRGGEIMGATIGDGQTTAAFTDQARARLPIDCPG